MHPIYLLQKFCQQKETVLAHVNQYVKNRKKGRFAFLIFFFFFSFFSNMLGLASSSFYKLICPILGVGCVRAVVSGRKFRSKTNFINLGRR